MNVTIDRVKEHILNLRLKAEERGQAGGPDAVKDALGMNMEADQLLPIKKELEALQKYILRGEDGLEPDERKALQADGGPQGGYAVPTLLTGDFLVKPSSASVGQLCTHRTLTKGDRYPLPTLRSGPMVSWYGEDDDYADDVNLSLGGEFIPIRTMGTRIPVTGKELDAVADDFAQWLIDYAGPSFDEQLDADLITGDGIKNVEGVLVAPGISEVVSGNASTLTVDGIRQLFFGLNARYRPTSTWVMNSDTAETVRGLKDSGGMPVYNEAQDTTFRRPIAINESMPDVAADAFPIVLGDWRAYYVVTRSQLSVFRNPYKRKPLVLFDLTKRVGGQVVLAEAFAKQKVSA